MGKEGDKDGEGGREREMRKELRRLDWEGGKDGEVWRVREECVE